jgi:hypothetical protein
VTSTPSPPPPPPQQAPPPLILRTLYRVLVNGTDRTTTFGPSERSVYPLEAQLYYVPDAPASDRTTLNRMVSAGGTDHADAIGPMNGYSVDETLGYPWSTTSFPGLTQIQEGFNSATGDYAMLTPQENLPAYIFQPLAPSGFPRYGNAGEVLLTLSAGGITVESNAVAGGVVWRWFWNGVQFINNGDYGREIQSDFYYPASSNYNPTEAGDSYHRDNPVLAHGSPLFRFENQGSTQFTRAVPLNWIAEVFGGDPDRPVIWNQMVLGKDLTLDFNSMGSVAKYSTHLVLPTATKGTFEAPVIYLRSNFNRFYTYDAESISLNEVTSQLPSGCNFSAGYIFSPHFGGAIISDASGANAMGIYGADDANGGSVNFFSISNFICVGDGPGESAGDTVAVAAVKGGFGGNDNIFVFPAGESIYNTYLTSGTLQNVTAQMALLYTMGAK